MKLEMKMELSPIFPDAPMLISALQACMGLASKTLIVTIEDLATHYVCVEGKKQEYHLWLLQVIK